MTAAPKKAIAERAQAHYKPLLRMCGVNRQSAGTLAGILGPGRRFSTDALLASYAGVAPLEASSAEVGGTDWVASTYCWKSEMA